MAGITPAITVTTIRVDCVEPIPIAITTAIIRPGLLLPLLTHRHQRLQHRLEPTPLPLRVVRLVEAVAEAAEVAEAADQAAATKTAKPSNYIVNIRLYNRI